MTMTGMGERNLEEAVFHLRKLNLDPRVRSVVEEAAELFDGGRMMEAGALIEKAEAMMATAQPSRVPETAGSPPGQDRPSGPDGADPRAGAEGVLVRMVGNLANGLAGVLVSAIQDLDRHITAENRKLSESWRQEIERIQASVESLVQVKDRIEQLADVVAEERSAALAAQRQQEELVAAVASLQQHEARREDQFQTLGQQTRELTAALSQQGETFSAQLGQHQGEIAGLKSAVSEVSPRVDTLAERLDRQAEAIRSIYETLVRREAALDQLADVITRLRGSIAAPAPKLETEL